MDSLILVMAIKDKEMIRGKGMELVQFSGKMGQVMKASGVRAIAMETEFTNKNLAKNIAGNGKMMFAMAKEGGLM